MATLTQKAGGSYPRVEDGRPIAGGYRHLLEFAFSVTVADADDIVMRIPVPPEENWLLQHLHVASAKDFAGCKVEVERSRQKNTLADNKWVDDAVSKVELGQKVAADDAYDFAPAGGAPYTSRDPSLTELLTGLLYSDDELYVTLDDVDFVAGGAVALVFELDVIRFGVGLSRGRGRTPAIVNTGE